LVFQDPSSYLVMGRVGDEVAFGLENRAVPSKDIWDRVATALAAVDFGYPLSHPTDRLSGGEQQRLAIADVLAVLPRLWLLDEPTANLDPDGATLVRATLHRVLEGSASTMVLVEHRVAPILDLVDRVVVLTPGGGVMADGRPGEVFAANGSALRAAGVWVPGPAPVRLAPPRSAGSPVVVAEGVVSRYSGAERLALEDLDLTANSGQVLAVTGANGSGKSTLVLVLASLLAPTAGIVRFLAGGPDRPYVKWRPRELVRWVGTVFQEPEHQFVASTVAAELTIGPRRCGMAEEAADRRAGQLLECLGLAALAEANPFTLSGGEKRRLSVAAALATDPALLVLDEPTFGQDARTWDQLIALLGEQRDAGRAVILATHDEDLVSALADRQVRLSAGRLEPTFAVR
jgi:energy-coupling factor transport system ATP-binding protein